MRVVHLSYVRAADADVPKNWLKKIPFFTGIAEAMSKHHEVHSIHCIGYSEIVANHNVTYHFFRLDFFEELFPRKLHQYVKQLQPDAVIVHGLHFPWKVLLLRRALGTTVKIFIQHHAEKPYNDFRSILQRAVDKFVSRYFFTSAQLAEQFIRRSIISDSKKVIEVMEASSAFSRRRSGQGPSKTDSKYEKRYLWVGRLDDNKDPATLFNAFLPFVRSHPNICLSVIFKNDVDNGRIDRLFKDVPENIERIGEVPHDKMEYWYNASDFVVSTSHYEGSGISICEGMSCGCIPVVTDIPSFKMMTANGKVGFIFTPGDAKALTKVLEKTLAVDVRREQARVVQHFESNLSFEAIAQKMITTIESV